MEDVEIVLDAPEEEAAPPAAPEEAAPAAPEAEPEPARAEEPEAPTYDATAYYRQRVAARQQRAEAARVAEIQSTIEKLTKPAAPSAPAAPEAPDRQKDPEGWALHQMQQAARAAVEPLLAPLLASREEAQRQASGQQAFMAQQQERMSEIAHLAEVQERHYPGYRQRFGAWSEGMVQASVQSGKPLQDARAEVASYIDAMARWAEGSGLNPVHEMDKRITADLGAWGWKPEHLRKKDAAAEQEVAETRKALESPAAKSLGGAARVQQPKGGKITGAALVKLARTNGGKVERGQLVAAAKSRMPETNGDFSLALDLVTREAQAAEERRAS